MCTLYQEAPALAQQGEQVLSTDELTGVQALERKHPGLPLAKGNVARRAFEYIRHGTSAFMLSRDVVTGKLVAPWSGLTRTEEDFLAHLQGVMATRPEARRWHFVLDNLNIHQSACLVRWVAHCSGLTDDLGVKGRSGILATQASRAALSPESYPQGGVSLHTQPQFLAQSDRNLAQHFGAQTPQTWVLYVVGRLTNQSAGVHRLLQPDDGETLCLDIQRQGLVSLNYRFISALVY